MGGGDQVVAVVEESLPGRDREVAEVGQAIVQMGEGEQVVAAIVHVGADMIEETAEAVGNTGEETVGNTAEPGQAQGLGHWGLEAENMGETGNTGDSRKHSGT